MLRAALPSRASVLWDDVASLRAAVDKLHAQLSDSEAAHRASTAYIDSRVDSSVEASRKGVRHALKEVIQRVATQLDQLHGETHAQVAALRVEQGAMRAHAEKLAARVHVLSDAVAGKDAQLVRAGGQLMFCEGWVAGSFQWGSHACTCVLSDDVPTGGAGRQPHTPGRQRGRAAAGDGEHAGGVGGPGERRGGGVWCLFTPTMPMQALTRMALACLTLHSLRMQCRRWRRPCGGPTPMVTALAHRSGIWRTPLRGTS